MNKKVIIKKTEEFVKKTMKGDPGHDWSHVNRVRNAALYIAKKEKADPFIIELAALLHDIGDYKFHNGRDDMGSKITKSFLFKLGVDQNIIEAACKIIDNISFKNTKAKKYKMKLLEGKIVQDSDRLDAIGAIGIARVFAFAGFKGKSLHDPAIKPDLNKSLAKYKKADNTAINHFYEKLLLLKDRMTTRTAKNLAVRRHNFMKQYLKEFYREWNGR